MSLSICFLEYVIVEVLLISMESKRYNFKAKASSTVFKVLPARSKLSSSKPLPILVFHLFRPLILATVWVTFSSVLHRIHTQPSHILALWNAALHYMCRKLQTVSQLPLGLPTFINNRSIANHWRLPLPFINQSKSLFINSAVRKKIIREALCDRFRIFLTSFLQSTSLYSYSGTWGCPPSRYLHITKTGSIYPPRPDPWPIFQNVPQKPTKRFIFCTLKYLVTK